MFRVWSLTVGVVAGVARPQSLEEVDNDIVGDAPHSDSEEVWECGNVCECACVCA